jgi:hypothetical protein
LSIRAALKSEGKIKAELRFILVLFVLNDIFAKTVLEVKLNYHNNYEAPQNQITPRNRCENVFIR